MTRLIALFGCLLIGLSSASGTIAQPLRLHTAQGAGRTNDIVDFNTQTLKYHSPSCIWAKRCTAHCIKISRAEAKQRGGIPCKVCGASE